MKKEINISFTGLRQLGRTMLRFIGFSSRVNITSETFALLKFIKGKIPGRVFQKN